MKNGAGIVIAGGGLAGQRCVESLRRLGYEGRITMACGEERPPYDRPPLSKELLAGTTEEKALQYRPWRWYEEHGVELLLGHRAAALEPMARLLHTRSGALHYEKLLVATGSSPWRLPGADRFANAHVLRDLEDAEALSRALVRGRRLAVIGAGFIGMEVAATARGLGVEVTLVEAAPVPLAAVLGQSLGGWFADLHREEGVEMLLDAKVSRFLGSDMVEELELSDGRRVACDAVVVGIGVYPATGWLRGSGLPHDGVPIGLDGATAIPHIYAAGDAALPFDERLRTHVRSQHWESAACMGANAARGMLGHAVRSRAAAGFWSDQYGVRIQYLGNAVGADRLDIDGSPADRDFAAVFSCAGTPVAGLLAGRPEYMARMRNLIFPSLHPDLGSAFQAAHEHRDHLAVQPGRGGE